jgi:hypothetical protein
LVAFLASLATSSAALAQESGYANPITFGIVGGATIPLGDLSDVAGTGWHAGALLEWNTPTFPLGVRVEGTYHKFADKDELDLYPNFITGLLNAVWNFPMTQPYTVRPYLIGGGGVYYYRCDGCSSTTNFGLNGGAGIRVPLSGISTIIEARFHIVFDSDAGTSNSTFVPISVGILFR